MIWADINDFLEQAIKGDRIWYIVGGAIGLCFCSFSSIWCGLEARKSSPTRKWAFARNSGNIPTPRHLGYRTFSARG